MGLKSHDGCAAPAEELHCGAGNDSLAVGGGQIRVHDAVTGGEELHLGTELYAWGTCRTQLDPIGASALAGEVSPQLLVDVGRLKSR